jgi:hypothetical protein
MTFTPCQVSGEGILQHGTYQRFQASRPSVYISYWGLRPILFIDQFGHFAFAIEKNIGSLVGVAYHVDLND